MNLAMSVEMNRTFGLATTLADAAALGFSHVELNAHAFGAEYGAAPRIPDEAAVAALAAALARHRLGAAAVSAFFLAPLGVSRVEPVMFPPDAPFAAFPRAGADEYVRYLCWLAQMAPRLGYATINCFTYPFTGRDDDDTLARFVAGMQPVLAAADAANITVCVEHDILCSLIRDEAGLARIFAALEHPRFGLTFDTANFYMAGMEPYPYAYERLRRWVRHIHLRGACEFAEGDPRDERIFPFPDGRRWCRFTRIADGALDLAGLLRALVADRFAGTVTLQPLCPTQAKIRTMMADDIAFVRRFTP